MKDVTIITLTSIVFFVVLTWIASALLALRDRRFPPKPRPEKAGPWSPPRWARGPRDLAACSSRFDTGLIAGVDDVCDHHAAGLPVQSHEHADSESADEKQADPRVK